MNKPVTAIYENGVLRPLTPLNLPEHIQVRITIQSSDTSMPSTNLWEELDAINKIEPQEIDLPPRKDRPNPILEMSDEFFI
ncbi:antitoxin family protein [Candidatus Halobeggiatoa sp. HSG11]|nr:antitoxin family protein [Candidatus Halobeggiatoa sp. HSG11]